MAYMHCCDWTKCTVCGECLMKCPVMEMDEEEAKEELRLLLEGRVAPRVFAECTLCFRCNAYCSEGLRPYELILQRISESQPKKPAMLGYFINGLPAPNLFQEIYGSLSLDEQQIIGRWSSAPEPAEDVLFVGCVGKTVCYDIENSRVLRLLLGYGHRDVCYVSELGHDLKDSTTEVVPNDRGWRLWNWNTTGMGLHPAEGITYGVGVRNGAYYRRSRPSVEMVDGCTWRPKSFRTVFVR